MGKIVTWDNQSEDRDACVFIRGHFYHKERDCHLHNGVYYSPFSRYYVLDQEAGQKVFNLEGKLKYGIIGVADDKKFVFGYFSPNLAKNGEIMISKAQSAEMLGEIAISRNPQNHYLDILAKISKDYDPIKASGLVPAIMHVPCMNVWNFLRSGHVSVKCGDSIIHPDSINECRIDVNRISAEQQYGFSLAYNSETMMSEFQKSYESRSMVPTRSESAIADLLGTATFGIEYESWDGRLPTFFAAKTGLIPLRDGSLRHDNVCGYEYASVIMAGERGVSSIKHQCKALRDFTTFNEKCSMHIHIGNIARTSENMVKLWRGFESIQDDLFTMFPSCLSNTSSYKQKDYCSKLPIIDKLDANSIVSFLSGGKDSFDVFGKKHPLDPSNQSKWNVPSRYFFVNFNNFYYTGRGTVELRISTPTFNHNKVGALLLIFNTIISEALAGRFHGSIESLLLTIKDNRISSWLRNYVAHRKKTLCQFVINEKGVLYHENIKNDESTGNKEELF